MWQQCRQQGFWWQQPSPLVLPPRSTNHSRTDAGRTPRTDAGRIWRPWQTQTRSHQSLLFYFAGQDAKHLYEAEFVCNTEVGARKWGWQSHIMWCMHSTSIHKSVVVAVVVFLPLKSSLGLMWVKCSHSHTQIQHVLQLWTQKHKVCKTFSLSIPLFISMFAWHSLW